MEMRTFLWTGYVTVPGAVDFARPSPLLLMQMASSQMWGNRAPGRSHSCSPATASSGEEHILPPS